ncbi:MAG: type IV pilin protein [Myxococcota bacterium]
MNSSNLSRRGFTLVELMIVVAIIGVLAAIGSIAYTKYVKSAKITELKQYALEVAAGQEQYKSRNSAYLDAGEYNTTNATKFEKLLGFDSVLGPETTVETIAGGPSDDCGNFCAGSSPPAEQIWYAVRVEQDLDPSETENTTVILHNGLQRPLVVNENK